MLTTSKWSLDQGCTNIPKIYVQSKNAARQQHVPHRRPGARYLCTLAVDHNYEITDPSHASYMP